MEKIIYQPHLIKSRRHLKRLHRWIPPDSSGQPHNPNEDDPDWDPDSDNDFGGGDGSWTVLMGGAHIDENNDIIGPTWGDQTKKEVSVGNWWNDGWTHMFINIGSLIALAQACEDGCYNDYIGYGQPDRNTLYTYWLQYNRNLADVAKRCNTDCSAFMNICSAQAGRGVYGMYGEGTNGWTTQYMLADNGANMTELGYRMIADNSIAQDSRYCVRGAIYVVLGHTEMGLTNGSLYKDTLTMLYA